MEIFGVSFIFVSQLKINVSRKTNIMNRFKRFELEKNNEKQLNKKSRISRAEFEFIMTKLQSADGYYVNKELDKFKEDNKNDR